MFHNVKIKLDLIDLSYRSYRVYFENVHIIINNKRIKIKGKIL